MTFGFSVLISFCGALVLLYLGQLVVALLRRAA